jgi:hypothetical protein
MFLSQAFIIAFTSNFIPRLVYEVTSSPTGDAHGYVNASLAYFDVKDFELPPPPSDVTSCRYVDYRQPYWAANKYEHTRTFWHILAARFIFIVIFQVNQVLYIFA